MSAASLVGDNFGGSWERSSPIGDRAAAAWDVWLHGATPCLFGEYATVLEDELRRVVSSAGNLELPTCPRIAARLVDGLCGTGSFQVGELEGYLFLDPAVAVKVVRLSNSPLFGKPGRISTLSHAVALLGPHVSRLAGLSFCLSGQVGQVDGFDFESYWRRSFAMSFASTLVAGHFPEVNIEEARFAGLAADIGRLILVEALGCRYGAICQISQETGEALESVEVSELGVHHATIAARVLREWHYPASIIESIESHLCEERYQSLGEHSRDLCRVLHLSRQIASSAFRGEGCSESFCQRFAMWTGASSETVASILDSVRRKVNEIGPQYSVLDEPAEALTWRARQAFLDASLLTARILAQTTKEAEEHERRAEEYREERDRLKRQVTLDPVLNIGNRRYFDSRLVEEHKRSLRTSRPLSLILFDLDHFKSLNDTYGHPLGDEALKASARTIGQCLRSSDVFSRYGGEEFAVICPETEFGGAMRLADRMRHCLERLEIHQRGAVVRVTASFGVATIEQPQDVPSLEELVEAADGCLFEAKRAGRNCVRGLVFSGPSVMRPKGMELGHSLLTPTETTRGSESADL